MTIEYLAKLPGIRDEYSDFLAKHILGMIFLQGYCMPPEVAVWSATLPTNQELGVYCVRGGSVNQSVAGILEKDHPGVKILEGGILGVQGVGK